MNMSELIEQTKANALVQITHKESFINFIFDEMSQLEFDNFIDWIKHLEESSCISGSWGSRTIYHDEIYEFIREPGILEILDEYVLDNLFTDSIVESFQQLIDHIVYEIADIAQSLFDEHLESETLLIDEA